MEKRDSLLLSQLVSSETVQLFNELVNEIVQWTQKEAE
jgi:hypothetical protein